MIDITPRSKLIDRSIDPDDLKLFHDTKPIEEILVRGAPNWV